VADTKVSALPAVSVAASTNELPVNEAGTSKKVTVAQLGAIIPTLGVFDPGSFTVAAGGWASLPEALILTGSEQATFAGDSILRID
jgi:hypothetical protein